MSDSRVIDITPRQPLAERGGVSISTVADAKEVVANMGRCTLLPDGIRNGDDMFMIVMTGAELGLGPMASIRNLHIIKGKVTMSAELMLSRLLAQGCKAKWVKSTNEEAHLELTRPGSEAHAETFTMEDARRAKLFKKDGNWDKYPKAMLRARCISAAARAYAPDLMAGGGVYTPEELETIEVSQVKPLSDVQRDVRADNPERYDAAAKSAADQRRHADDWFRAQQVVLDNMAAVGKALDKEDPRTKEDIDDHLGRKGALHEELTAWIRENAADYVSHNHAAGKGALSKARSRLMHAARACGVVAEMNDMIQSAAAAIKADTGKEE